MHWAGTPSGRVGRGTSSIPACETRWIVPVKPYQAPRGSREQFENILLGFRGCGRDPVWDVRPDGGCGVTP